MYQKHWTFAAVHSRGNNNAYTVEKPVDPELPCRCYHRELDRLNSRSVEEVEMISRWEDCEEKLESFIVV